MECRLFRNIRNIYFRENDALHTETPYLENCEK